MVGVRALVEQRLHDLEVGGLLQFHLLGLREPGTRLPRHIRGRPERRHAVVLGGNVRVGAPLDQHHRRVELAVDDGSQQRARGVAGVDGINVGAAFEQSKRGLHVALAGGVEQRGHAALGRHGRIDLVGVETAGRRRVRVRRRNLARAEDFPRGFDRGLHLVGRGPALGFLADEAFDHLALALNGRAIDPALLGHVNRLGSDVYVGATLD